MIAVAYIRVSSESQLDGHSMHVQERAFYTYCPAQDDWTTGKVYREEGKSAHVDTIRKRPVFKQLLEDAAKGEFDVVVIHTLDRWARNQMVLLESLAILDKNQVKLVSITEPIDWSTPMGKYMGRTVGNNSEFYSDMLAVHVEKGITGRVEKGLHLGPYPSAMNPVGPKWAASGGVSAIQSILEEFTFMPKKDQQSKSYTSGMPPDIPPAQSWRAG